VFAFLDLAKNFSWIYAENIAKQIQALNRRKSVRFQALFRPRVNQQEIPAVFSYDEGILQRVKQATYEGQRERSPTSLLR